MTRSESATFTPSTVMKGTYAAHCQRPARRRVRRGFLGNEDELSASQKKATASGPCARRRDRKCRSGAESRQSTVRNGPYRTGSHRRGSSSSRASFISIHAHSREQTRPKAAAPPVRRQNRRYFKKLRALSDDLKVCLD